VWQRKKAKFWDDKEGFRKLTYLLFLLTFLQSQSKGSWENYFPFSRLPF
jgi:hypothetical protein